MNLRNWLNGVCAQLRSARRVCRGQSSRRRNRQLNRGVCAEIMEARQYPAAALVATLTAGVLNIEGTTKADTITVQQTGDQLAVRNGTTALQVKVGTAGVNQVSASQVQLITINSLGGNDTIRLDGVSVAAIINGGDGLDNITGGNGNDTFTGGLGNDILNGGGGVDTLIESGNFNFVLTNAQLTSNGTDKLTSIELARLTGGAGNNKLDASTFTGSVTLDGSGGNDTLVGGLANDSLIGGAGNDSLIGNDGDDVLEGGAGDDNLNGGAGNDRFVFTGSTALGVDTITVGDNQGTNTLDFSAFRIALSRLDLGQTTSQTVNASLKLTIGSNDAIDNVLGTDLADLIFGNGLSNSLIGRSGNDTMAGNAGNDLLDGGAGLDSLDGGADNDTILGGDGDDQLFSGTGTDSLDGGAGSDTINGTPEVPPVFGFAIDQITSAYNTGRVNVQNVIQFIVSNGLGQDLPVVQETVGDVLDAVNKLRTAFDNNLSGTKEQIESALRSLQSAGFTLEYLAPTADANGDLLRITYDRTFNTDRARFNIAGATGLDYFDKDVNGSLSGSFNAQSPTVTVHITFGVDAVGRTATSAGTPTFYVADSSSVAFDGLHAQGQVNGEMALRFLADVQATGTLTVDLGGSLRLHDSDSDHKLRVSDLSNASSIVGDVDGSIVLNADIHTNLPVLRNITWHGDWRADIVDGRVNVGSPTLRMPTTAEVEQALITSFVDMKNNFNFLGPIADALNIKLPVLGKTLADAAGVGDKLGWLTGSINSARADLSKLGIQFANIDANTVGRLINGDKVDLIWFHQESHTVLWNADESFLFAAVPVYGPFILTMSGEVHAEVGWDWSVGFGLDTTGVWIDSGTHVGIYGSVRGGVSGELSFAGIAGLKLEAGVGVQISAGLGLRDPDPSDGHIYMDEIIKATEGRSLTQAIGEVMQFNVRLGAQGYVRSELDLPWPLPNITLFDQSFSIGDLSNSQRDAVTTKSLRKYTLAGQGAKDLPAILQADGTLLITGTSDRDFMSLSGKDGTVSVKSPGYRTGQFTGVRKVVFNCGDGDDQLAVADGFNIPIQADGGDGNDLLMGGTQNDTLNGGAGSDQLNGQNGDDVLNGNGDADSISGGAGNDQITGGSGDDLLQGGGDNDHLDGQEGNDDLEGDSGNDVLDGGVGNDVLFGGSGQDILNGQDGDDALNGDEGNDQLNGGIGNDVLSGGASDDSLNGGEGDDSLSGDTGNDSLYGALGQDTLLGGEDDDFADGGSGRDLIFGDAGNDELHGGDGDDTLRGGDGDDVLRGGRGNDELNGDGGADDINGEAGEDIIAIDMSTSAGTIEDTLAGGVDRDTLWIAPAFQNVTYNETTKQFSGATGDNWIHVEQTSLDDFAATQRDLVTGQLIASVNFTLTGGTDTDLETITIAGLDGNDFLDVSPNVTRDVILDGGDGNDTLLGGSGRDVIRGGTGNDSLVGNANNDELHGGLGNDTLEGDDGTDRLYGDDGDDSLNGGSGFDAQFGGDGRDLLVAGDGQQGDQMYGGDDNDTILGGDGIDVADGQAGDDEIHGGKMSDVLIGGDNNDTIYGDAGRDLIFGDAGSDVLWASDGSPETSVIDPNWTVAYAQLVAREFELVNSIIPQLESKVHSTDPTESNYAVFSQQLVDAANELVTINDAEDSLNPYQNIKLDRIDGGDGDDELHGSYLNDFLFGGAGDDRFYHTAGNDLIFGGDGTKDAYLLDGTSSDDTITINGVQDGTTNLAFDVNLVTNAVLMTSHISLDPDVEAIGVRGLGGNDTMTANLGQNALKDIRFEGGNGNDNIDVSGIQSKATLIGSAGDDTLVGGLTDDSLDGGTGNDSLSGGSGSDTLLGGDGNDTLDGGANNDSLDGGSGNDSLGGGDGRDTLVGGTDDDTLSGGADNDSMNGGDGQDQLDGQSGHDTLHGDGGNDILYGGEGNDSLTGDDGNDKLYGGEDNDTLDGGAGQDSLDATGATRSGRDRLYYSDNDTYTRSGNGQSQTHFSTLSTNTVGMFPAIPRLSNAQFETLVYRAAPNDNILVFGSAFQVNGTIKEFSPNVFDAFEAEFANGSGSCRAATIDDVRTMLPLIFNGINGRNVVLSARPGQTITATVSFDAGRENVAQIYSVLGEVYTQIASWDNFTGGGTVAWTNNSSSDKAFIFASSNKVSIFLPLQPTTNLRILEHSTNVLVIGYEDGTDGDYNDTQFRITFSPVYQYDSRASYGIFSGPVNKS